MGVTQQVDALEALAIDSFKYLVTTRILACIIALPVLTSLLDFSGMVGGWFCAALKLHLSMRLYLNDAFDPWSGRITYRLFSKHSCLA